MKDVLQNELDVVVVGSGGAGCTAAVQAAMNGVKTAITSKGPMAQSGATLMSGADLMLDGKSMGEVLGYHEEADPTDSKEKWMRDIVVEGFHLSNQKLVEMYVENAPYKVKDLLDWGLKVDFFLDSRALVATGSAIARALRKKVRSLENIVLIENFMATDLLIKDERVCGVIGLDLKTGKTSILRAKAVVLATGGIHQLFPFTTGTDELSGDGQAMAYRAGAEMVHMEFVSFCPMTILGPPKYRGSHFTYVLHILGGDQVLDNRGQPFLYKYSPEIVNLAVDSEWDKAVMSKIIATEIAAGKGTTNGGVWYSIKAIPLNIIEQVENLISGYKYHGTDYSPLVDKLKGGYAIEVAPAAHYFEGGIRINENCETSIPGLFAAGECTSGLFGASRVSSAITEMIVEGNMAGRNSADFSKKYPSSEIDQNQKNELIESINSPIRRTKGIKPWEMRKRLHELAWKGLWVIRDGEKLTEVVEGARALKKEWTRLYVSSAQYLPWNREWIMALELRNLLPILELMSSAALKRTESRGTHFRADYPETDYDKWTTCIYGRLDGDKPKLFTEPPVVTQVELPKGKMDYWDAFKEAISSISD